MPTNGPQMTKVDESLAEFISSTRTGRRDALPDITDSGPASRTDVAKSTVDVSKSSIKPEDWNQSTSTVKGAQPPPGKTASQEKTPSK